MNQPIENLLRSAKAMTSRARDLYADLDAQLFTYLDSEPLQLCVNKGRVTGIVYGEISVAKPVPDALACYVGDLLNNCRAALDQALWEAVERAGVTPGRELVFPIRRTRREVRRACKPVGVAAPWITRAIVDLEPFYGGKGDALYHMNNFINGHKHRRIIPLISAAGTPGFHVYHDRGTHYFPGTIYMVPRETDRFRFRIGRFRTNPLVELDSQNTFRAYIYVQTECGKSFEIKDFCAAAIQSTDEALNRFERAILTQAA